MIVKKYWRKYNRRGEHSLRWGIFLFGFIPLYVEMSTFSD